MAHIANERIKKGGKFYAAGSSIELSKEELAELPVGAVREDETAQAVSETDDASSQQNGNADTTDAETFAKVRAAVLELTPEDFKQDGDIRSGALKTLNEKLGMQLTAENVAVAKNAKE